VTLDIVLRPLEPELHPALASLWQLYRHDMSDYVGTHGPDGFVGSLPDEHGRFHERTLRRYLDGALDADGYLLVAGERAVGLAFVRGVTTRSYLMGDFFLVRGLRGRGVAAAVARELFARYPGRWEVPFQEANAIGGRFWRRLAREVARGEVQEERRPVPGKPEVPHDVWLTFDTAD
jgi:predicted acetyltransferase